MYDNTPEFNNLFTALNELGNKTNSSLLKLQAVPHHKVPQVVHLKNRVIASFHIFHNSLGIKLEVPCNGGS